MRNELLPSCVPCLQRSFTFSMVHALQRSSKRNFSAGENPVQPPRRRERSSRARNNAARRKLVAPVTAAVISPHKSAGSLPASSREVICESCSSSRFAARSRSFDCSMTPDLSSINARIMPKATKNFGTFHSSGFTCSFGAYCASNAPAGNTAPQATETLR